MIKKGLIFDLDGTLWDSAEVVADAWKQALADTKYTVSVQTIKKNMGKSVYEIAKILFAEEQEQEQRRLMDRCIQYQMKRLKEDGGILYEDLKETLHTLKQDYELYIVSNCPVGYIENFLEFYHLKAMFTDYEYIGRTGLRKGENIKMILQRNNLKKALYIGDTQGDYTETLYAGIPFVFAQYGFGVVADSKYVIKYFKDLPNIIEKVFEDYKIALDQSL